MMKEFNLDGYSSIELENLIKAASLEKGKREIEEKVAAFGQLEEIAKSVGLTLDQLIEFGKTHNKKKKTKTVEPRYRSKADPENTWTGRGQMPRWLKRALLHKDLKCKAPLIEPNLRRNLGKWST
ncbi:H-NS histone family protein [Acinetobacter baumannii]|uniref:H-NS histone family protein n=1 Tax=Acinetobacter baumannii TaxID=470 RepID=UPI002AAECB5C|nr:H-NS histone family protein [Acinetobacter baumannii]MDY7323591.1 H-NS histone family protein [Acinetobacter baumannii]MDY7385674.1 H-NS histone family protein [Acinetobacter baumannii]